MKKIIAMLLCLVFCLGAFVGCAGLKEDEKGAVVRMFLTDYPYTLDPAVIPLNSDVDQILSLIYEPLTTFDEDGELQPALATEWYYKYDEIYQLHKMYFKLKDTSWSDNRKVSADDVIYAWRRILSPEMDSPYASLLYCIKGARDVKSGIGTIDDLGLAAVDDTELEVTFEGDYSNWELFAEQVANIHLAPCREDVVARCKKNGEDWAGSAANIVCSGPFRVQAMDMPREEKENEEDYSSKFACKLVLERNSYYLRMEEDEELDKYVTPYRITCYYYEGQTAFYENELNLTQEQFQANRFVQGESYFLSDFDKNTYSTFKSDKKYGMETSQTLNGYAYYFNTANELLSDAKVRQAFSAAIDRNVITTEVTATGEIPATGYVPNGVFNTSRKDDFREVGGALYNTSADMESAKSLVSGASKGTLTVTYLIPQNAYTIKTNKKNVSYNNVYEDIAKSAGEAWKALGYDIQYRGLNPDEFLVALKTRDYDIIGVNVLSGSTDAFCYLAPFAKEYSGTGIVVDNSVANDEEIFNTHYTNIDSTEYSELISSALVNNDRAARAEILHQAESKLVELCPATMVFWYTRSFIASDKISGYESDSWFGYMNFTELELKDWREVNASEAAVSEARNANN